MTAQDFLCKALLPRIVSHVMDLGEASRLTLETGVFRRCALGLPCQPPHATLEVFATPILDRAMSPHPTDEIARGADGCAIEAKSRSTCGRRLRLFGGTLAHWTRAAHVPKRRR